MKTKQTLGITLAAMSLLALAAPAHAQHHHGGGMHPGSFHHGHVHGNGHVNFFFGGFGYPFYWGYGGYPYWGPYWGYPYPYPAYPYYGYPASGVYEGRMANPPPRSTNDGAGKDVSMAAHVQRQLASAGYYDGAIDGIVGEETRQAIRDYQRANNLPVNGRINAQLLDAMGRG